MAGKKRPNMFDDLPSAEVAAPAPAMPPKVVQLPTNAAPAPVNAKEPRRYDGKKLTTLYLPQEVHRRIAEIAFHEGVKAHDLMLEGINLMLEKRGHRERAPLSSEKGS